MSAGTLLAASIVLRTIDRKTAATADSTLDDFISTLKIDVVPVTVELANRARLAHAKYGKGTGHPAQLNFRTAFPTPWRSHSMLYKGGDFSKTDIVSAI